MRDLGAGEGRVMAVAGGEGGEKRWVIGWRNLRRGGEKADATDPHAGPPSNREHSNCKPR